MRAGKGTAGKFVTDDKLFTEQNMAIDDATRKTYMDQMQQLMYDQAPYHILYYDATLVAYRTDRFTGWSNQPLGNGTPLFGYGSFTYTTLLDATAATPSPTAVASASSATGASSPAATPTPSATAAPAASGDMTPIILGGGALVVIIALAIVYSRLRFGGGRRARDHEDE